MVERVKLTAEIVEDAAPVGATERWIADTDIRGFGLRVWRSPSGAARSSYGLRITDSNGRSIRKTLSFERAIQFHYTLERNNYDYDVWSDTVPKTLADLVDSARQWASDTIATLKNFGETSKEAQRKLEEAEKQHGDWVKARVEQYTLETSSAVVVKGLWLAGRSEGYCDRLGILFQNIVPGEFRNMKTSELTPIQFEAIFGNPKLTDPQLRELRPHLRKCLELSHNRQVRCKTKPWKIAEIAGKASQAKESSNLFESWSSNDQSKLLDMLINNTDHWPQSLCFLCYLETTIPLSRLMRAEWADCFVLNRNLNSDPNYNQVDMLIFGGHSNRRNVLSRKAKAGIEISMTRQNDLGIKSPYIFPNLRSEANNSPISSIAKIFVLTKSVFQIPDVSPRNFRAAWHASSSYFDRTVLEAFSKIDAT